MASLESEIRAFLFLNKNLKFNCKKTGKVCIMPVEMIFQRDRGGVYGWDEQGFHGTV